MSKKLNKNVPVLRFPEFDGDWKHKSIQEISINGFSNGVFNDPEKVGTGYRLINVKNMYSGDSIDIDSLTRLELNAKEFLNNQAKYGDIFFTRSSLVKEGIAYSNVLLSDAEDITYDGHLIKFSPNQDNYLPQFIALALKTDLLRSQLVARGKTGTMTTIGQDDVATVKIFCPSIAEQEKIASFLGAVDTRLNQLRRKREHLQTYKRGVMQKLFSQQIHFNQPDGSPFPPWKKKKLGNISDVRDGTHESPKYYATGKMLITSKNLMPDGSIDFKNVDFISELDYENINKRSKVSTGDILFGMIGTIGNPVLLKSEGFAIKNVALIKGQKKINNKFLIHYLKSQLIKKQFHEQNTGGTQKFIALGVIRLLEVLLPCLEEQEKIANFLNTLDRKIDTLSRQIDQTEQFKKGLLQKLFV